MNYYGKAQCLDMDWDNVKEITAEELAYCIFTHILDINMVSDKRLSTVKTELIKRKAKHNKEQNEKQIKNVLAQYKPVLAAPVTTGILKDLEIYDYMDEVIDYLLDPTLFYTPEEAALAVSGLNHLLQRETTLTEIQGKVYKDPNTRARDIQRLQQSMEKIMNQYKAIGGDISTFIEAVKHLPTPEPLTLDVTIKNELESLQEKLTNIGVSKTRATKISKSIIRAALTYLY